MSTTIERNSESPWRKRSREEDLDLDLEIRERKRPRDYYFRLASESSKASEDDTESICSLQDKETDVVRDTSDTESQADSDIDKYEVEIEYEVASLSESDVGSFNMSSSDPEDMVLAAAAAVIYQSDLEVWVTDGEDSESSSGETSFGRTGFSTCAQCRGENDNPMYRYCEKCFQRCRQCKMRNAYKRLPLCQSCYQDRKKFYPPRPRRRNRKKETNGNAPQSPIKLSTLQNFLSGMSQDSGVGSSQECPQLNLDSIYVPEDARSSKGMSKNEDISRSSSQSLGKLKEIESDSDKSIPNLPVRQDTSLKRKLSRSESSDSDIETKKPKFNTSLKTDPELRTESTCITSSSSSNIEKSSLSSSVDKFSFSSESSGFCSGSSQEKMSVSEIDRSESALCIFCNSAPKDSIFLHTNIAHRCCCYKCAKKTLRTIKRCPICNRAVNKIVKIYTS